MLRCATVRLPVLGRLLFRFGKISVAGATAARGMWRAAITIPWDGLNLLLIVGKRATVSMCYMYTGSARTLTFGFVFTAGARGTLPSGVPDEVSMSSGFAQWERTIEMS